MISQEEGEFYSALKQAIKEHPEWMLSAMQAITSGIEQRLRQERHEKLEWETVAFQVMAARISNSNKMWLSQKIDRLRNNATFNWDKLIERLQK